MEQEGVEAHRWLAEDDFLVQILAHLEREVRAEAESATHPEEAFSIVGYHARVAAATIVLQQRSLPPVEGFAAQEAFAHLGWQEPAIVVAGGGPPIGPM